MVRDVPSSFSERSRTNASMVKVPVGRWISAPREEGNHAVGVGVSRTAHGAGGSDGGALGSDRSPGPDRSVGHPLASHRADARGRLGAGDKQ